MRLIRGAGVALLLLAAACGPIPQPFSHGQSGAAYPLAELAVDVRVAPVAGLPDARARELSRAVAGALGAFGVTATERPDAASRFVLAGAVETDQPGSAAPAVDSTRATISWTLFDAEGEMAGIHVQEVDGAAIIANPPDPQVLQAAGFEPAKALAALVAIDAELPSGTIPKERNGLFVAEVEGAPGDGNAMLPIALRLALSARGFQRAERGADAAEVVRGFVTVDPPAEGNQRVVIRWRVTAPDGATLGEARQENTVPAGSLDGRWGAVAGFAAAAAVDGIAEILDRTQANDAPSDGRAPIVLPPSIDLPEPPGMARPPAAAGSTPANIR